MASKKPTMILKSKTDMTGEEISNQTDSKAWEIIYAIRVKKVTDERLQVCFTGFKSTTKEGLINLAHDNRYKVRQDVTKKLDFLVSGDNAGPKKIEKAESQGVQFLNEIQYRKMIET